MALTDERRAWLTKAVADLDEAISLGALRVRYADRDVTYRSVTEMKGVLADYRSELNDRTRPAQVRFQTGKGF